MAGAREAELRAKCKPGPGETGLRYAGAAPGTGQQQASRKEEGRKAGEETPGHPVHRNTGGADGSAVLHRQHAESPR